MNPRTSAGSAGIVPAPHKGGGCWHQKVRVGKCLLKSTCRMRVVSACLTPCCSVEITSNEVHVLILHNCTNCKEELLPNTEFLGQIVVDVQRHDREGILSIARLPTKSCFSDDALHHPIRFSFSYLVLLASPGVVKIEKYLCWTRYYTRRSESRGSGSSESRARGTPWLLAKWCAISPQYDFH